jgi:hypothetical protein
MEMAEGLAQWSDNPIGVALEDVRAGESGTFRLSDISVSISDDVPPGTAMLFSGHWNEPAMSLPSPADVSMSITVDMSAFTEGLRAMREAFEAVALCDGLQSVREALDALMAGTDMSSTPDGPLYGYDKATAHD